MRRAEYHDARGRHEGEMAKSKRNRATLARTMHKEAGMTGDAQSSHSRMADALEHEAELHEAQQLVEAQCQKAAIADEVAKAQQRKQTDATSRISGVVPNRSDATAVPRVGQESIAANAAEPQFVKMLGLDAASMHVEERSLLK
jgi:hypothetical protein